MRQQSTASRDRHLRARIAQLEEDRDRLLGVVERLTDSVERLAGANVPPTATPDRPTFRVIQGG